MTVSVIMTKAQKIWFGMFLAMFVTPEIIWGPLLGIIAKYSLFSFLPMIKDSQLINDNVAIMNLILLSEIVGLGGLCILNYRLFKKKKAYVVITEIVLVLVFILLISVTLFYNSLDKYFS